MESGICRINIESFVWHDLRCLPTAIHVVIIDFKHVISLNGSESVYMVRTWLLLENWSFLNHEVARNEGLFHCGELKEGHLHHAVDKHAAAYSLH